MLTFLETRGHWCWHKVNWQWPQLWSWRPLLFFAIQLHSVVLAADDFCNGRFENVFCQSFLISHHRASLGAPKACVQFGSRIHGSTDPTFEIPDFWFPPQCTADGSTDRDRMVGAPQAAGALETPTTHTHMYPVNDPDQTNWVYVYLYLLNKNNVNIFKNFKSYLLMRASR